MALLCCVQAHAEPRGTGLLPEDPVSEDVYRSMPQYRDYLPAQADLSDFFPVAGDQGTQGSCTAWSTAYGIRSFYDNVLVRRPTPRGLSPAFVYNQLKTAPGDCSEPLRISDALRFLEKRGTVPINDFPYQPDACSHRPSNALQERAGAFRISGWERLNHRRLDDLKGEVAQGNPVVIGMGFAADFQNLEGSAVYRQVSGPTRDLTHAVVIVGYDESKEAFRVFNSWGPEWGERGYAWIGYEAARSDMDSAFVARMGRYSLDDLIDARRAIATAQPAPAQQTASQPASNAPAVANSGAARTGEWKRDLGVFAAQLSCANLSMEIEDGTLRKLQGFVASEDDLFALTDVLAEHAETSEALLKIAIRPWPQCEALTTFARTLARPQGLAVEVVDANGGATDTLAGGDLLGVAVKSPDFPAYLYVTYLQSAGDAVHLVGWQGGEEQHPPNASVVFGLDPAKPRFRIGPPFGREMILAIASRVPLFDAGYDILEEERTYLTRFRQRLLEIGSGKITGQFAARAVYLETDAQKN